MNEFSIKSYLIRAVYDWCSDNSLTAYLAVKVDEHTRVPMAYVKDGEIVLNISMDAVHNLHIGNDSLTCSGRFGGVSHGIVVPIDAVVGVFSKETGQGLVFRGDDFVATHPIKSGKLSSSEKPHPDGPKSSGKPQLRVVK